MAIMVILLALCRLPGGGALADTARINQPKRVISINACTDQLLFALADREQIIAMTHYAKDPAFSLYHKQIAESGIELIRGSAEEVLKLGPDLVLAGTFTRHATRQRLEAFGVRVETYSPAKSIADAKADIRRLGKGIAQEARAERLINDIDAMLHSARDAIPRKDLSVLQLRRNAYLAGVGTLFDDVLTQLGLKNAGRELGLRGTRQAHLEQILKIRPDVLVMFETIDRPRDQGSALLFHPAMGRLYASSKRMFLPGNQIICGGPSLLYLLRSLKRGFATLDLASTP
jgi:iron complex transport system substrate-binding protein